MNRETKPGSGELITSHARYRIVAMLGRGGMGVVYKAIQETEHLRRPVALKVLAPELAQDDNFRQRFLRESRLAAGLNHPNIIPIYDADEARGQLLLAMPLVDGKDLASLLNDGGPLSPESTINIIRQVAAALDNAHREGLVHRDVKPGNILVVGNDGPEGQEHVYLCDFGLTKKTASQSGLTVMGHFLGTLEYIAPEQIEGRPLTPAADIYALGCVLFECLTGSPPFRRDNDLALLHAHVADSPPPVGTLRRGLPEELDEVVARAMAKQPEDRYASCRELVSATRDALAIHPLPEVRPPPRPEGDVRPSPRHEPTSARQPRRNTGLRRAMLIGLAILLVAGLLLALGWGIGTLLALPA